MAQLPGLLSNLRESLAGMYSPALGIGIKVMSLACALLLVVHLLACGWYTVGYWYHHGWLHKDGIRETSHFNQYFTSLRWTIAQLNGRTDMREGRSMEEMALWIEWRNQGTLMATSGSHVLSLCSDDLKRVLRSTDSKIEVDVSLYAWCFARTMKILCDEGKYVTATLVTLQPIRFEFSRAVVGDVFLKREA